MLIIGDFVAFYVALFVALFIREQGTVSLIFYNQHILPFSILFGITVFILYMVGFYEQRSRQTAGYIFSTLLKAMFFFTIIAIAIFYFLPIFGLTPKVTLALFIASLFVLLFVWRLYAPHMLKLSHPQALLVGGPNKPAGFDIINIIPSQSDNESILNAIANFSSKSGKLVLMDFTSPKINDLLSSLHSLMLSGIIFIDTSKLVEEEAGKVDLDYVDEAWLLQALQNKDLHLFLFAKRVIDITVAIILLPIYILLLPFVALAIKAQDGGCIFFKQQRMGIYGTPIYIYKFRTMNGVDSGAEAINSKLRVTRVGSFLRKSHIDELPQLWSILKGDIALIGPRPEIVESSDRYKEQIPYYSSRYIVRPGLTGWAQVMHKNEPHHKLDVEATREKLAYDLYYIKNLSTFLELKIILKTVRLLLSRVL